MIYADEKAFEVKLRRLIAETVCKNSPQVAVLDYKTVGDIIIARDGDSPALFFLEAKYYQQKNGRIGFGNGVGEGIQPEILKRRPAYLENHLRWVLGSDSHGDGSFWLVSSEMLRNYVAGGVVGVKQNNIKEALFREVPSLIEEALVRELEVWLVRT
jgi:hypothetical protein